MRPLREEHRVGVEYLEAATVLLQRARGRHPTVGLYEAADLQWWSRTPRPTDDIARRPRDQSSPSHRPRRGRGPSV